MNAASKQSELVAEEVYIDFRVGGSLFKPKLLRAVSEVSFTLKAGEALAIVGESGSGKSTVARALCRVHRPTAGKVTLDGEDILNHPNWSHQRDFAQAVQMIFQDPFSSLNPVHTIRHHLLRPVRLHGDLSRAETDARIHEILERVGLTPADRIAAKFPHELSGGQRQRVAIARALAVGARFILADEPISMLDVSIRLGILNLMHDMKKDGVGFMYITHDIATARYFAERTAVMYVGHMVEWGESDAVTQTPRHPYTQLLLSAVPEVGRREKAPLKAKKAEIPIRTPQSIGCPFVERCPHVENRCRASMPPVRQLDDDHFVRCFQFE